MPPKTRATKATKALKENSCVINAKRLRKSDKVVKPRRALADKTNSASDDNASTLTIEKQPVKAFSNKKTQGKAELNTERPRRERRVPKRFKENNVLNNASTCDISQSNHVSLELSKISPVKKKPTSGRKIPIVVLSPLKTPRKALESSLIQNRPKRICKLPSKFDDHSTSPNKFIPLQPINASTPLANKTKEANKLPVKNATSLKNASPLIVSKETQKQKTLKDFFNKKTSPDSNNNAKQRKQKSQPSPNKSPKTRQTIQDAKNSSIKLLGDNKKPLKRDSSKLDIYEFTYDPHEEPPPAKKKKKKPIAKKPTKPKVTIRSNYDKNLAKALAALKNTVTSKSDAVPLIQQSSTISARPNVIKNNNNTTTEPTKNINKDESIVNERNYNSVRVEDIAMDMQPDDDDNIDYSPINSPSRPQTPAATNKNQSVAATNVDDPLNLRDDISFFDEQPVASSSMNVSVKHPMASPWRVDFGTLPIKWQCNTYVKPNMTPAVESSFINCSDTKKKYVYTNLVTETNQSLPEIVPSTPNLKQTSIMSFIKEVVEKNENKKKKSKSTPVKANSLFEDITNTSTTKPIQNLPRLNVNSKDSLTPNKEDSLNKSNNSNNTSNTTEGPDVENSMSPTKKKKKTDKDLTYFGFNESEDQENISPKKKNKARSLRSRTRGILQELNIQKGPMRAVIPVAAKTKPVQNSDVVNKIFDTMKSATEPPVFPDVAADANVESTNVAEPAVPDNLENEDSESVHLFEDIEFLHHQKVNRKSYGKPKKVAFNKNSAIDDNSDPLCNVDPGSSDEDLDDLSFRLPSVKAKKIIKKKKIKQKLSKKEEKEVEAWAAGFNSMCEDIEEFDLLVE